MLKDAFNLFKQSYNEQTMMLEKGKMKQDLSGRGVDLEMPSRIETQSNISRMFQGENETINAFVEDPRDMKKFEHQSQDFDTLINVIVSYLCLNHKQLKKMDKIEKEWVLGDFDNVINSSEIDFVQDEVVVDAYAIKFEPFLDTLNSIRSPAHVCFDIILVLGIMILVTIALETLYNKAYIRDYHVTNIPTS